MPLVPPCTFPTSPASLRPPQTRRRPRCRPCFSPRHAAVPSANTCLKAPMTVMRGVLRVKGRTIGPKYLWLWGWTSWTTPATSSPHKNGCHFGLLWLKECSGDFAGHVQNLWISGAVGCWEPGGPVSQVSQQFGNQRSSLAILCQTADRGLMARANHPKNKDQTLYLILFTKKVYKIMSNHQTNWGLLTFGFLLSCPYKIPDLYGSHPWVEGLNSNHKVHKILGLWQTTLQRLPMMENTAMFHFMPLIGGLFGNKNNNPPQEG